MTDSRGAIPRIGTLPVGTIGLGVGPAIMAILESPILGQPFGQDCLEKTRTVHKIVRKRERVGPALVNAIQAAGREVLKEQFW